ncbi:MAG TPA: tellurite resistance/C4-dicarboxylate transporter family protein [Ktedonobacterales bacterium]|nr:tellurite resistance/C4-dicarboxylate transporter family protein [Ktedonobacterales bacterium]
MRAIYAAWLEWVRTLYTGYFACVMATGIVSVALLLSDVVALSRALWVVGFVLLAGMALVYAVRIIRYPQELKRDLNDPTTAFGFFTFIAAVGVMATRSALSGWTWTPAVLTGIAALVWLGLTYWVVAMLIFTNEKPVERAINGAWLIAIVATESLAITWVLLTSFLPAQRATLQLVSYSFWTFGVLLYLIFIALIMYRFFFFRVLPGDLKPPYWINMGAMAITTVAGVRLLDAASPSPFLLSVRPYIQGFTVMMWAWGTWWIPLLLIIGVWKYGVEREPIRYDPALWSIVFPLGMYSTSLQLLTHIPGLEFLVVTGPASAWIAFAAWALVAAGWIWSAITGARRALSKGVQPSQLAEARAAEPAEPLEREDAGVGEVG